MKKLRRITDVLMTLVLLFLMAISYGARRLTNGLE